VDQVRSWPWQPSRRPRPRPRGNPGRQGATGRRGCREWRLSDLGSPMDMRSDARFSSHLRRMQSEKTLGSAPERRGDHEGIWIDSGGKNIGLNRTLLTRVSPSVHSVVMVVVLDYDRVVGLVYRVEQDVAPIDVDPPQPLQRRPQVLETVRVGDNFLQLGLDPPQLLRLPLRHLAEYPLDRFPKKEAVHLNPGRSASRSQ